MVQTITPDVASIFKDRSLTAPPVRKKKGQIGVILLVLLLVLLTFGAVRSANRKPVTQDLVSVVGAGTDIAAGTRITFSKLHYVQLPKKYYSAGMFTSSEQLVGAVSKVYIPASEPITKDYLFPKGRSLSANLETYERALSLRLDDESTVDHTLGTDDLVDVIAVTTKNGKHFTKTIGQNIRVLLATSKDALESRSLRSNDANKVTIAVTPADSELISEAAEQGKIKLVLRSRLSRTVNHLAGVIEDDLLPAKAFDPPKSRVAAETPMSMQAPPVNAFAMPAPSLPPPPTPLAQALTQPVEWIVEMFSGNKRSELPVSPK